MKAVDSTFLIDVLENRENISEIVKKIEDEPIYTTHINIFEILVGIFSQKDIDVQKRLSQAKKLFNRFFILGLDEKSVLKSAQIAGDLNKKGAQIENMDCLTAGIILSNGVNTIITRNKKHFDRINDLKVEIY